MATYLCHGHFQTCPLYCCLRAQSQQALKFGLCYHSCSEVTLPQMPPEVPTLCGHLSARGHMRAQAGRQAGSEN